MIGKLIKLKEGLELCLVPSLYNFAQPRGIVLKIGEVLTMTEFVVGFPSDVFSVLYIFGQQNRKRNFSD